MKDDTFFIRQELEEFLTFIGFMNTCRYLVSDTYNNMIFISASIILNEFDILTESDSIKQMDAKTIDKLIFDISQHLRDSLITRYAVDIENEKDCIFVTKEINKSCTLIKNKFKKFIKHIINKSSV